MDLLALQFKKLPPKFSFHSSIKKNDLPLKIPSKDSINY